MAFTYEEIRRKYDGEGLVIAEIVARDGSQGNRFAILYEVLITTKNKEEAQLLLDMHKEIGLDVVMIETFNSNTTACHFSDGELMIDNMQPNEIAEFFRSVFNMENMKINNTD